MASKKKAKGKGNKKKKTVVIEKKLNGKKLAKLCESAKSKKKCAKAHRAQPMPTCSPRNAAYHIGS